jgi:poly(A) polymerase
MKLETYDMIISTIRDIIKDTVFENYVYSVGGCERDRLLGNEIKDIDLVVNLPNGGINLANYLNDNKYTLHDPVIYESFGTAMFKLIDFPTIEIEVVQTRKECYRDVNSRNPETTYGTINDDAERRDFTVNAFYRNISSGKLCDFNGNSCDDILNGVIRCCGEPDIIFKEDALRILRAFRFASRLEFKITHETYKGIFNNVERLNTISRERITDEFSKILVSKDPFIFLDKIYLFKHIIFPFIRQDYVENICTPRQRRLLRDSYQILEIRLAILFQDLSEETIRELMFNMKYPNKLIDEVIFLIKTSKYPFFDNACGLYYIRKAMYESKTMEKFYKLTQYLTSINLNGTKVFLRSQIEVGDIMYGYKLGINGNDIIQTLKYQPGPIIKTVLDTLLSESFSDPLKYMDKEECLTFIENIDFINNTRERLKEIL